MIPYEHNFFFTLGAIAIIVLGMKMMSEAFQKVFGDNIRQLLESSTKNKFQGIFNGFFSTALVQSSSATIIITVSLVNVGILTLLESGAVILGANVGTTISSWMIALFGFNLDFEMGNFVPIIAIGVPFLFAKNKKIKFIGECIIGFSLLFIGLEFLKNLSKEGILFQWISAMKSNNMLQNGIVFIIMGALFSFVLQSTAVAVAITQTLAFTGIIPIELALLMVLGHNVGSIINAELTAVAGNVHAKRAARIHSVFNLIGVAWIIVFLPYLVDIINHLCENVFGFSSIHTTTGAPIGVAIFHTSYNFLNVILMMGLIPLLVKIATKTVKSKGNFDEEYHLEYINNGLLSSSEIAITEAKKEIVKFADLTKEMNDNFKRLLKEQNHQTFDELILKMRKHEDITDNMEEEITNFLTLVSQGEMTEETSFKIRRLIGMVGDLEQIGDIYYAMALIMERKKDSKIWFIQEQRDFLNALLDQLKIAFDALIFNLNCSPENLNLSESIKIEAGIDKLRDDAHTQHLDSMEKGDYNFKGGMYYKDLFTNCERIGDYIIKVNKALVVKN